MQTLIETPTVAGWHWPAISTSLDEVGYAVTPTVLSPADCADLIGQYDQPELWRARVEPDRYRLGPSEYRQFDNPLPDTVAALRTDCYAHLAPIANAWQEKLGLPAIFPDHHDDFLGTCHSAGHTRPTPLISRHRAHDYTSLHQDDQSGYRFPLQLMVLLSQPAKDYMGGEFVVVENLPRAQSRARVVPLKQGQAVLWPTSSRPGAGKRGHYQISVRYGISTVHTGTRHALGITFHDTD
jgi:hypothetical protein